MQSGQVNTGGLLVTGWKWGAHLISANQKGGVDRAGAEWGRAAGYHVGSRCSGRGGGEEGLTSGGVRKGGGVSERTRISPLGHTR